jgi:predicted amidohydrolase
MSHPELRSADRLDVVVRGGRVLDPGRGVDAVMDVGIADGRIDRLEPVIGRGVARRVVDARGKLVIEDVVRMVTCNVAAMLGMVGEIGTLAPGAAADVTVLAIDHGRFTLSDSLGEEITSSMRLRPEITVRGGKVSRPDSPLLGRSLNRAA